MNDDTRNGQGARSRRRGRLGGHSGEWSEAVGGHGDHFRGPGGPGRRGRGRRGDVRGATLALLAERPMHGYEILQELAERTQGVWRPSPGSVYPALQLLEDQGLVTSSSAEGRRQYTLTDEGRAELAKGPTTAPWESMMRDADQGDLALRRTVRQLVKAAAQVMDAGTDDQKSRALTALDGVRRQMYLILAETEGPSAP
jgi:DNA-binding PadR family transcriptional regulator